MNYRHLQYIHTLKLQILYIYADSFYLSYFLLQLCYSFLKKEIKFKCEVLNTINLYVRAWLLNKLVLSTVSETNTWTRTNFTACNFLQVHIVQFTWFPNMQRNIKQ